MLGQVTVSCHFCMCARNFAGGLLELGVNAVELLPMFEYDQLELQRWRTPPFSSVSPFPTPFQCPPPIPQNM